MREWRLVSSKRFLLPLEMVLRCTPSVAITAYACDWSLMRTSCVAMAKPSPNSSSIPYYLPAIKQQLDLCIRGFQITRCEVVKASAR